MTKKKKNDLLNQFDSVSKNIVIKNTLVGKCIGIWWNGFGFHLTKSIRFNVNII